MRANLFRIGAACMLAMSPGLLLAHESVDPGALVEDAFAEAKAAATSLTVGTLSCTKDQQELVLGDEAHLSFPCELQDVVEDADDAKMLVTLLLAEPPAAMPETDRIPATQGPSADRMDVGRIASAPSLAAYASAGSRTLRAESARLNREEERLRTSARTDEIVRENRREEREEELARQAEFASVTRFLELASQTGFCPADGRIFLRRASEYATSPIQEDRIYGRWADDKRHALEPYLNDLSRCR